MAAHRKEKARWSEKHPRRDQGAGGKRMGHTQRQLEKMAWDRDAWRTLAGGLFSSKSQWQNKDDDDEDGGSGDDGTGDNDDDDDDSSSSSCSSSSSNRNRSSGICSYRRTSNSSYGNRTTNTAAVTITAPPLLSLNKKIKHFPFPPSPLSQPSVVEK